MSAFLPNKAISKARDEYVETVTCAVVAYLKAQGITLTDRAQEKLSDLIRFDTTP